MAGLALLLAIVAMVAVVVASRNQGSASSVWAPTNIHTFAPIRSLVLDLPDYTLETLRMDEAGITPQSRAYKWLIHDPNLESYTEERRIQRYALAVFFYSTNGEPWHSNGVMSPVRSNQVKGGHGRQLKFPNDGPRPFRKESCGSLLQPGVPPPASGQTHISSGCDHMAFIGNGSHWLDYAAHECTWFSKHADYFSVCNGKDSYEYLDLNANGLKGTLPPELALLSDLKITALPENKLYGSIPTEIGMGWQRIETFHVTGLRVHSELSGTLPSEIGLWNETFVRLRLMKNNLFGTLPTELFALTKLVDLTLVANSFSGPFFHPELLANMQSLKNIEILRNDFDGTIPTEIGLVSNLEIIAMHQARFTGTLPSELGLLSNLYYLSVGDNYQISGALPSELALLPLHTLSVKDTEITGSIPSELGNIEIPFIYLQRTGLTGTIPPLWCNATVLYFSCSDTLCGCDCPCISAANHTN